jgi:hypothetical protein
MTPTISSIVGSVLVGGENTSKSFVPTSFMLLHVL